MISVIRKGPLRSKFNNWSFKIVHFLIYDKDHLFIRLCYSNDKLATFC